VIPVPLGRFKVAHWDASTPQVLRSRMFSSLESAEAFGRGLGQPYLIMRAEGIDPEQATYAWEVLPTGAHSLWSVGSTLYRYRWPLLAVGALLLIRGR